MDQFPAGEDGNHPGTDLRPGWSARGLTPLERRDGDLATPPRWARLAERAVAASASPGDLPATQPSLATLAVPFRSFAAIAHQRIVIDAAQGTPALLARPETTAVTFISALSQRLAALAERTLMAELAAAQASGRLTGHDDQHRFAEFIGAHCTPSGLAGLLDAYPVLARLLGTATLRAADAGLELLARFAADRDAIITTLLAGVDPGPITAIEPGLGNPHQGGRSVTGLSFADGRKLIYRPRSVTAHAWFGSVLDWLNRHVPGAGLRIAAVVPRFQYGWEEFIEHRPPADPVGMDRFYWRYGVLLAVLYVLDIQSGSLLASGDSPVPLNVEAIFHPALIMPEAAVDPAAAMLAASVHRTGLLQAMDEPARRMVQLRPHDPAAAEMSVLAGFRLGYEAIAAHRDELERIAGSCRDVEVRLLSRPTTEYTRFLADATAPELLRDAGDWEAALGTLGEIPARHPQAHRLVPHELADLHAGDVPLFTRRPGGRDAWTSAGVQLSEVMDRPGLDGALGKIAGLSEVDRRDQEWIVSATMAAQRLPGEQRGIHAPPDPLATISAEPARLLAVACGLADQVVSHGVAIGSSSGSGRVNWLGLQTGDDGEWAVSPMGADLGNGYIGVALFLAQLADLTGVCRYSEVARQALDAMPSLFSAIDGYLVLSREVGCGGYHGLGGMSYGLARMTNLLDDSRLGEWITTAVRLASVAANRAARPGWADGTAGCLAAMTAVWSETGSLEAAGLARVIAGRLAELVDTTDGWCLPDAQLPGSGFARGPAGIGSALARYASATGEAAYLVAGRRAVRRAVSVKEASRDLADGWCHGTAGLLVARCLTEAASPAELHADLLTLSERPVLPDLSLCDGEFGIAEALSVLSLTDRVLAPPQVLRRRVGMLLDALHQRASYCGTPGGVFTPGLLHGLAGIGYGLLRLGFPQQVPAVLALEPAPAPSTTRLPARQTASYNHVTTANRRKPPMIRTLSPRPVASAARPSPTRSRASVAVDLVALASVMTLTLMGSPQHAPPPETRTGVVLDHPAGTGPSLAPSRPSPVPSPSFGRIIGIRETGCCA
jgi:lantibiotic modifying enzyme